MGAQVLPEVPAEVVEVIGEDDALAFNASRSLQDSSAILPSWDPVTDLASHWCYLAGEQGNRKALPIRYIDHQRYSDLYWKYLAQCEVAEPASLRTFMRAWHGYWKNSIGMRKVSQHAMCQVLTGTPSRKSRLEAWSLEARSSGRP